MSRFPAVTAPTYMDVLGRLATGTLFLAVGCGGSSAVLQSNDAGSDGDAAVVDVADATDAPPTPQNVGGVGLSSVNATTSNPPTESSMVNAGFALAVSQWCASETIIDGCSILDCKPPVPSPAQVSAGTVLVTGGKQPVSLTPKKSDYPSPQSPLRLWDGGEALQLVVAGDVAPAFTLSLIAPAYVLVDGPVWPTGGAKLLIPRANDLKVSWSGGGAGSVYVRMMLYTDTGTTFSDLTLVDCPYLAQTGSGKVSAKVLSMLPASATRSSIEIFSGTHVDTTVSGWRMTFSAVASANTPTGIASASIVLQ